MTDPTLQVGYAEEASKFLERNRGVERLYEQAMALAALIYGENNNYSLPAHGIVIFGLLATSYEIFLEIFYLAANGFGRGAQARLRTMYEHVAVAAFLNQHPEQAERFIRFQVVEHRKELLRAKEVLTNEQFLGKVKVRLAQLESQLSGIKDQYGKRFARSWHEGMAAIAEDLG